MKLRARRRFAWANDRGVVERGEIIDTDDFPSIPEHKWNQLRNPGSGHFLEDVAPPGRAPRDEAVMRGAAERARAKGTFGVQESDAAPALDAPTACECGFVANTSHGLLVHRGRKHKE